MKKNLTTFLNEAKKSKTEFRIVKRIVHDLEYKDEFGRWMKHSSHDSAEAANKKIRGARIEMGMNKASTAKSEPTGWEDPGRTGVGMKNPYGE